MTELPNWLIVLLSVLPLASGLAGFYLQDFLSRRRDREERVARDWTELRSAALRLGAETDHLMRIMTLSVDTGELDRMEASGAMSVIVALRDEVSLLTSNKSIRNLVQKLVNKAIEAYADFTTWHYSRITASPPGWEDSMTGMSEARSSLAARLRELWDSGDA